MIYLSAIGFTPGGSSTVHIYTQTISHILNMGPCIVPEGPYMNLGWDLNNSDTCA